MNNIKVIMCEVGKKPYIKEIPNELEEMQKLVGGYIEVVSLINGLIVVCNEEGRLMNLPINNNLGLNIFGNFFIVRTNGEEFASIKDEDMETLNRIRFFVR